MIGDDEAQTPFELLRDKNLLGEVDGLLEVLDPRETKIISQRFGLDGGRPKTLENVGKDFWHYAGTYSPTTEHCIGEAAPRAQ